MEAIQETIDQLSKKKRSRLSPWVIPEKPIPIEMGERDINGILREVRNLHVVELRHIHAILGHRRAVAQNLRSTGIAKRLTVIFRNGYLIRPESARPTRAESSRVVYMIGPKGAQLLIEAGESIERRVRDFAREIKWTSISHEVNVATVNVAVRMAAASMKLHIPESKRERFFTWVPYPWRKDMILKTPSKKLVHPDGQFTFRTDNDVLLVHYFEVDQGTRGYGSMKERFQRYHDVYRASRKTKEDRKTENQSKVGP